MSSVVEICNLALSNIRAGSINSLTEGSLQAQQCSLKYTILRDRCLREISWQFNHKIRALSLVTTEVYNWAYAYSYPQDCLKIKRLIASYEGIRSGQSGAITRCGDDMVNTLSSRRVQVPYEVFNFNDNKIIATNEPDLYIDFSAKVTDPNLFSDDFILALSHLLASEIAIPIVGAELGRALRNDSIQLYRQYLASAIATDMNDQYFMQAESDFINVRN